MGLEALIKLQNRRMVDPAENIPLIHEDAGLLAFDNLPLFEELDSVKPTIPFAAGYIMWSITQIDFGESTDANNFQEPIPIDTFFDAFEERSQGYVTLEHIQRPARTLQIKIKLGITALHT